MTKDELISIEKNVILGTYARPDFMLSHGKGVYLYDTEGKRYLDFSAGIAVNALGHCDDGIQQILHEQATKLWHTSNLYYTAPQIRLAKLLTENTFADKVFFCNSGAEAIEGTLKFSRRWAFHTKGKKSHEFITFHNSFHGRTYGAISATGQSKFWEGFEPLLPGFKFAEFNDLESVNSLISEKTCAVLIEPVQGEGGVFPADKKFLQGLRKLCNENKLLLLLDEIQCGMGRTGKFCAYEHYSIVPDILTMAKPIAGGLPMGVILLTDEVGQYMNVGSHGSTFGGGPLVSSVAEYVVKRVTEKSFLAKITENGKYLVSALEMLKRSQKMMKSIRGKGLIVGVEFKDDPTVVVNACYTNGLLVCKAGNNTLRFIPPLIAEKVHIDECIDKFDRALNAVGEENA